jgi:hypothetical protein
MTPIGHFMCASAIAGDIDLLREKETNVCFAYYAAFLAAFWFLTRFLSPGVWAMYLHDWFGNAALIYFLVFWSRKDRRRAFFVALLIGGQVLAAYSHAFDFLALKIAGYIPEGMWRPHNIIHTPLMAFLLPLLVLPIMRVLLGPIGLKKIYFFTVLGYVLHIICDTITYDYKIYPVFPFSGFNFSIVEFFQKPDVQSAWLGNPLYVFEKGNAANVDGFIVYKSELAINLLLMLIFYAKSIYRRLSNSGDR